MSLFELICCGRPDFIDFGGDGKQSNIVDIEKLVTDRAWKIHNKGRRRWCTSRCLEKNKRTLELDWSGVKFHPETPEFEDDGIPTHGSNTVFKTVFENNSESTQEQTLKAERTTSATCTSSLTKGYSIGCDVKLSLKAPKTVVNAAVGFSKGFTIQNAVQNQEEHSLTWSTEGKLVVLKNSKITAKLQVTEQQSNFTFKCKVAVQGNVKGTFYDYNKKIVEEYTASMRTILLDEIQDAEDASDLDNAVYLTVWGKCGFKFGIEQEIKID